MAKVLYIGGYGRSGSTIIELVLASNPNMISTGELTNLFSANANEELCEPWVSIANEALHDCGVNSLQAIALNRCAVSLNPFIRLRTDALLYRKLWTRVFELLERLHPSTVILDSSKTSLKGFFRPKMLEECRLDVHILHIVRSPFGVASSYLKGSNQSRSSELEKPKFGGIFRVMFNWLFSNVLTHRYYKMKFKGRYLLMTYERIMSDPEPSLKIISEYFDLPGDYSPYMNLSEVETFMFSGNRLMLSDEIYLGNKSTENTHDYNLTRFQKLLVYSCNTIFKLLVKLHKHD